jgi:hypothetical protein
MYGWSDAGWLTRQLGPVWVISALMGRNRFDELERRRSGRPSRRHYLVKLPALVDRVTSNRRAEPPKRLTASGGVGSGDIDARDVKAQEAAEGCAEYERPQEYRQYRYENT